MQLHIFYTSDDYLILAYRNCYIMQIMVQGTISSFWVLCKNCYIIFYLTFIYHCSWVVQCLACWLHTSFDFLPQSRDLNCRLISMYKQVLACQFVYDCAQQWICACPGVLLVTLCRIEYRRQMDGQTDRRTDRLTDGQPLRQHFKMYES